MTPFRAYRLPVSVPEADLVTDDLGALRCLHPAPDEGRIRSTATALREAGSELAGWPVAEIVAAIDAAAARLADPADPLRKRADRLLPAASGYSPALARLVLDRMTADWRADRLRSLLDAELGDPAILDRFMPAGAGRRTRAYGLGLAFHVFAGNVPGVAVTSIVRSLLVKTPVLGKLASGEPVLPVLFGEALDSVDPALGAAVALAYWPGGSVDAERAAVDAADLVVVYGGGAAVAAVRSLCDQGQRVVVHGPRFSAGLVGADAVAADPAAAARRVAHAVAAFDQHGCVSPHAVWVEAPGGLADPGFRALVDALPAAFEAAERELPRGRVSAAEAAAIQQERGAAEMRGYGEVGVRVLAGEGTSWTVVIEQDPSFRPSCLNRFLRVHPVERLDEAVDALAAAATWLQSVAIDGAEHERDRLAHRLARLGATRVTTLARLPWPPPTWHHDGHGPLRELIRWVDLED